MTIDAELHTFVVISLSENTISVISKYKPRRHVDLQFTFRRIVIRERTFA